MCTGALNKIRHDQSRWMIQDQAQSFFWGVEGRQCGRRPHMGAEGPPQPAKQACLPQGLALGAHSAPLTIVENIDGTFYLSVNN